MLVVSTHSRLKAAGYVGGTTPEAALVSTHSRLKAAGTKTRCCSRNCLRFNTQPPEGGWDGIPHPFMADGVSTHSRPKAAGKADCFFNQIYEVSTHSRPKAAGQPPLGLVSITVVSTHSRPKAAGSCIIVCLHFTNCFNTQPPEGGWSIRAKLSGFPTVSTHSRPKAAGHL